MSNNVIITNMMELSTQREILIVLRFISLISLITLATIQLNTKFNFIIEQIFCSIMLLIFNIFYCYIHDKYKTELIQQVIYNNTIINKTNEIIKKIEITTKKLQKKLDKTTRNIDTTIKLNKITTKLLELQKLTN